MPIDPAFSEMMPHTITVFSASTVDKYGKQAFSGTGVALQCRLVFENRMIRDTDGREISEAGRAIIFGPATTVQVKDRIALPGGRSPLVVSVSTIKDEVGDHHSVIGFGI